MGLKNNPKVHDDTIFASVLADGKIHVTVPEGTEGAVKREYETSDGKKGSKTELVYTELVGMIKKLSFYEGQYGVNLLIAVAESEDEKSVTLSLPTESNFGEDVMKKLPNIDQKREVTFSPFSFENDKGKKQKGVSILQKTKKGEIEKVVNFYYDTDKKVVTNGYPEIPKPKAGKAITKSEWRKYFAGAREFLIEDLRERLDIKDEAEEAFQAI